MCIRDRDTIEANGDSWTASADTYVCNGPFMPKEFYPNEKFGLVKNPNYYEADNVKLETLEYVFLNAAETEMCIRDRSRAAPRALKALVLDWPKVKVRSTWAIAVSI